MVEQNIKTKVEANDNWLPLKGFSKDAEIDEKVQMLHCDTRDFHIIGSNEKPKVHEKPDCNYEYWRNEGLNKFNNLIYKPNRENYAIKPNEIIPWLLQLCEATGGFDKNWRCINADVKNCGGWNLKYVRFIRNNRQPDEFIVCNSYLMPVHYKEVIPNLHKDLL
jgi:hypothetical protein